MTDTNHEPTRDFTEFLARDIARTIRHDQRFSPSARAQRIRRLGVIAASAIGTVVVLAVGLVFGTSTGYASARAEVDRQRDRMTASTANASTELTAVQQDLARIRSSVTSADVALELRGMEARVARLERNLTRSSALAAVPPQTAIRSVPVKQALSITCIALSLPADTAHAPQVIPTLTLQAASAKTAQTLRTVAGIHEVAGGRLVVNEGGNRQLRVFDSTLATSSVTSDSAATPAFGPIRPMLRYLGDSSVVPDAQAWTLRVFDGNGQFVRTIALPDAPLNLNGQSVADSKGRLYYTARMNLSATNTLDSAFVLRVDLASHRVDTVARIKSGSPRRALRSTRTVMNTRLYALGGAAARNIVGDRDDWTVLPDGTIAVVRGHDYHLDWMSPAGAVSSSAKLPFDWPHLAELTKQLEADTTRLVLNDPVFRRSRMDGDTTAIRKLDLNLAVTSLVAGLTTTINGVTASMTLADADGNVWILPTVPVTPDSELVYDVVSAKGELFQRVRVPAGRAIIGFGKGGTVYLLSGNRANGLSIERTRIAPTQRPPR